MVNLSYLNAALHVPSEADSYPPLVGSSTFVGHALIYVMEKMQLPYIQS